MRDYNSMGNLESLEQEPSGGYYLELLGLGDLSGYEIQTPHHGTITADEFMDVCGPKAGPHLKTFDQMDPSDPKYNLFKGMLRRQVLQHMGISDDTV